MSVVAPPTDIYGAQIDAAIATMQALVNATPNSKIFYPQYVQHLNDLQVQAINHYMSTYWLAAYVILATYGPLPNDKVGQTILQRVAFLQNLVNNAPAMPPGNSEGYGGSGWTTLLAAYQQLLYSKQTELVQHIIDYPGATSAATMLANLTGFQSQPFEYVFNSVGFTDSWVDD